MDLTPWKTYATGALIVIHQLLKANGYDVPEADTSAFIDGLLAVAAIGFRIMGHLKAKAAVQEALMTPVPTDTPKP